MAVDHVGAPDEIDEAAGQGLGGLGGLGLGRAAMGADLEDGEFVAAEPRDHILAAGGPAKALCDLAQERVADRVAEGVVDRLEAVEVEHQHRQRRARPGRLGQRRVEVVVQADAVAQSGERLLPGQGRAADMLGHVLEGEGEAAGRERRQRGLDEALVAEREVQAEGAAGTHRLGEGGAFQLRAAAGRRQGRDREADQFGAAQQRRRAGIGEGHRAARVEQDERGGHLGERRLERRRARKRWSGEGGHAAGQRPVGPPPVDGPSIGRPPPQQILKVGGSRSLFPAFLQDNQYP